MANVCRVSNKHVEGVKQKLFICFSFQLLEEAKETLVEVELGIHVLRVGRNLMWKIAKIAILDHEISHFCL